jgi:hypothetical protein
MLPAEIEPASDIPFLKKHNNRRNAAGSRHSRQGSGEVDHNILNLRGPAGEELYRLIGYRHGKGGEEHEPNSRFACSRQEPEREKLKHMGRFADEGDVQAYRDYG